MHCVREMLKLLNVWEYFVSVEHLFQFFPTSLRWWGWDQWNKRWGRISQAVMLCRKGKYETFLLCPVGLLWLDYYTYSWSESFWVLIIGAVRPRTIRSIASFSVGRTVMMLSEQIAMLCSIMWCIFCLFLFYCTFLMLQLLDFWRECDSDTTVLHSVIWTQACYHQSIKEFICISSSRVVAIAWLAISQSICCNSLSERWMFLFFKKHTLFCHFPNCMITKIKFGPCIVLLCTCKCICL